MCVEIRGVALRFRVAAAVFCACWINYGSASRFFFAALAIVLHEATHLLLMRYYGCRHVTVDVLPGAVRIRSDDFLRMGYRQTAIVLLCAPVGNLLAGTVFLLCGSRYSVPVLFQNAALHLALGGINLLPMSFLDGGKALQCFLAGRGGPAHAGMPAKAADGVCLAVLAGAILLLAARRIFPAALYLFFIYCAVTALLPGKRQKNC